MLEQTSLEQCFFKRKGCPFCGIQSQKVLYELQYHETGGANKSLPNIEGKLYHCESCGVAYPSHLYNIEMFPELYKKSAKDLVFFDNSPVQILRRKYLTEILRNQYKTYSLSRILDSISMHVLHPPLILRKPSGIRFLDVGCGCGHFLSIYQQLGNKVTGTEIFPYFVDMLSKKGFECYMGELENIDFHGEKFDVILLRAVFYRTRNPVITMERIKDLLAPGGEVALLDPYMGVLEAKSLFKRQFPQGQFYILDQKKYLSILQEKFNLSCQSVKIIYGKPSVPLSSSKVWGNLTLAYGLFARFFSNLLRRNPCLLSYNLISNASV